MDQIQAIRLFALVAETHSFTVAAQRLAVPRASASEAIAQMETRLGVKLLTRTTRSVKLTDEGRLYLESCTRLLQLWDDANQIFDAALEPEGLVRIDMPERMAHLTVIPALPDFFARYPKMRVLVSGNARFIDLAQEDVDVVIRVGPLQDSPWVARNAGELQLVDVGSPGYLERHGVPVCPEDLSRHVAVGYGRSATAPMQPWDFMQNGKANQIPMPISVAVTNTEALIPCALAGLGLIQVPELAIREHLLAGDLVEVMPDFRPAPLAVSILYTDRRLLSRRIRVMVDWLHELLRKQLARTERLKA